MILNFIVKTSPMSRQVQSLDRAICHLENRIKFSDNPDRVTEYTCMIERMKARREQLLSGTGESLIEQILKSSCGLPVKGPIFANCIARAFRDAAFTLFKVPGDGNCLFHTVATATGYMTSELRQMVASRATHEEFVTKKGLFESALEEHPRIQHRLVQTPPSSPYYADLKSQLAHYADDIVTYGWLRGVESLEQYRAALEKHYAWGDGEAIGHIECLLNVKLLIFLMEETDATGKPHVYCNAMTSPDFVPFHYIMVAYYKNGKHYELIKHSGRSRFTLEQLPLSVRTIFGIPDPDEG